MTSPLSTPAPPLQAAVTHLADAIGAVIRESLRIAQGGEPNAMAIAELQACVSQAAIEAARHQCEREAALVGVVIDPSGSAQDQR